VAAGIASYILFLADTTGQASKDRCKGAYSLLDSYNTYEAFIADIGPDRRGRHCHSTVILQKIRKERDGAE
jgi:hypothetical protein